MRTLFLSALCVFAQATLYAQAFANNQRTIYAEPLAGGTYHSLFIRNDGLYAAGQNVYGQLGIIDKADAPVPVGVGNGGNYVSVSTRTYNTLALRADGSIWAWGFNNYGEAGNGNRTHQFGPSRVGKDTTWVCISAGESFCLAIKRNGTLWGWGLNSNGELGTGGSPYNSLVPIQIGKEQNWQMVAAGVKYALAIKKDGGLWAWGNNQNGELGINSAAKQLSPVRVGSYSDWKTVACGQHYSLGYQAGWQLMGLGKQQ